MPLHAKQGDKIDFYAPMDLLILVWLRPCGDQTASWQDVTLTPMKVEILETEGTPPQFPRFHDWRRTYPPAWWRRTDGGCGPPRRTQRRKTWRISTPQWSKSSSPRAAG